MGRWCHVFKAVVLIHGKYVPAFGLRRDRAVFGHRTSGLHDIHTLLVFFFDRCNGRLLRFLCEANVPVFGRLLHITAILRWLEETREKISCCVGLMVEAWFKNCEAVGGGSYWSPRGFD